jgi:cytidylate kinase
VRDALLDAQRAFGADGAVVLEGRDIGTVVFPDAEVKVFLTASDAVRARRRYDEFLARGVAATYEATLDEVRQRDAREGRGPAGMRSLWVANCTRIRSVLRAAMPGPSRRCSSRTWRRFIPG